MRNPRRRLPKVSPEGQACLDCHSTTTPGIVTQWRESSHAKTNVDCYSCHKANANDPATFEHYGQRIAVIVTPNYCGRCHAKEQQQFAQSHHAAAAQFIGSLDNMLGEVVEGGPAANNGCRQCHGSEVKYLGTESSITTPGRTAASGGSIPTAARARCAACHGRHSFSSNAGARAGELRQVPPRPGPSADRDLQRVEARHPVPRQHRQDEPGRASRGSSARTIRPPRPAPPAT